MSPLKTTAWEAILSTEHQNMVLRAILALNIERCMGLASEIIIDD